MNHLTCGHRQIQSQSILPFRHSQTMTKTISLLGFTLQKVTFPYIVISCHSIIEISIQIVVIPVFMYLIIFSWISSLQSYFPVVHQQLELI